VRNDGAPRAAAPHPSTLFTRNGGRTRRASDRKCREVDRIDRHCASRNLERPVPLTQRKRCGGVQRLIFEPISELVSRTADHRA